MAASADVRPPGVCWAWREGGWRCVRPDDGHDHAVRAEGPPIHPEPDPVYWAGYQDGRAAERSRAEGLREHLTDEADPLACWCQPYRDTEEPEVILHRKEAEA